MSRMGSHSFTLSDSCTPRKRDTSSLQTKPLWVLEVGYTAPFLFTPGLPPVLILTRRYGNRVSTVRAALEVKQVFEQLAEAEKGGVTPEQKQQLEEQATEKVRLLSWEPHK